MDNQLPKRKNTRLQTFDYNSVGGYFITICTENRRQILSHVVGADVLDGPPSTIPPNTTVILSQYGEIANKYLNQLNDHYTDLDIVRYVIMPNHIHIMLVVKGNGPSRTSAPTKQHSEVSRFVSTFKRFCNKEYGLNIWQRGFHDHIIRDRTDYEEHLQYIQENPIRWRYDELYSQE